ncbi:16S rRNA (cytosine(967)-C(5))-methyltransferase RsmB [Domibacillus epiphyticus]|uniref:16S rRNA (cytosine(967)-C(5))-methyltransferase n=1 Tax=Domibacillus epiphyticus TaxID=1714355 RepID=A0A1V2ACN2_9BACI|nr:16S rRNA (cytosine(967)-C(5))-methyltransferase RsmB [Domibacillus epiphyticus]OMP68554.1 16S rRNA (cytosine(967)-C(5))-methyltransferase [Domibacillus epiphyticus]
MGTLNVRETALELIESVEKSGSYSNLLLNNAIEKNNISGRDAALLTEITYGTIQRKLTLDFYLAPFLKKKPERWVNNLLRLSLYQMVYLDKVPERAVIHEAVNIAKKRGHKGIAGMVNGVLRSIQREGLPNTNEIRDEAERISVETSHPLWLVKRWIKAYGAEKTEAMCRHNLTAPEQTVRVNKIQMTRDEAIKKLKEEGFDACYSEVSPFAIRIARGNAVRSTLYKDGAISIQDESSMLVAPVLGVSPGQRVLDMCAAPGGKTAHIAEIMNGEGHIDALDIHAHKLKLVEQNAERLSLSNIHVQKQDARKAGEIFESETFDAILVDAPCSGLGVIRRKPDLKYVKTEEDLDNLQSIQLTILAAAAPLVKDNGVLVYSTCTVDKAENEGTVASFLKAHPEFEAEPLEHISLQPQSSMIQIFPDDFGGDGFFISKFRKKERT